LLWKTTAHGNLDDLYSHFLVFFQQVFSMFTSLEWPVEVSIKEWDFTVPETARPENKHGRVELLVDGHQQTWWVSVAIPIVSRIEYH
jgi:hypothetical protein